MAGKIDLILEHLFLDMFIFNSLDLEDPHCVLFIFIVHPDYSFIKLTEDLVFDYVIIRHHHSLANHPLSCLRTHWLFGYLFEILIPVYFLTIKFIFIHKVYILDIILRLWVLFFLEIRNPLSHDNFFRSSGLLWSNIRV